MPNQHFSFGLMSKKYVIFIMLKPWVKKEYYFSHTEKGKMKMWNTFKEFGVHIWHIWTIKAFSTQTAYTIWRLYTQETNIYALMYDHFYSNAILFSKSCMNWWIFRSRSVKLCVMSRWKERERDTGKGKKLLLSNCCCPW